MGCCYPHLSLDERRKIANWRYAKTPVSEIGDRLGRDPSTIYREIKRNSVRFDDQPEIDGYYGMVAQRSATQRRARRRKLVRLTELRKAVIMQLKEGLLSSLQAAIAGQWGLPNRLLVDCSLKAKSCV